MWDAGQYLRFGGERARPFFNLVAQVGATSPRYVADLGCGPGNLTAALAARWPGAMVTGVDNSTEMITAARAAVPRAANLSFTLGDVRNWRPGQPLDVLVCNAVLQWVPGHDEILLRWADLLAPGGWLAFQLPGNFDQPSHEIVKEMARSPRWRSPLADVTLNRQAGDPAGYVALLARPGFEVDAWETSYLHILLGENPVLEWTKGSTLRPVLSALDPAQAGAFLREYGQRLLEAYRPRPFGTVFPFRRVFAVVHRTAANHTIPIELLGKAWHDARVRHVITTTQPRLRTPRQLAAEVRRLTSAPAEWVARVRLDPEGRWYEQIRVDDSCELWLISWLPGQSTGFHDHGGANGAFGVVWGELDEHVVAPGPAGPACVAGPARHPVAAGQVRSFGAHYVHDVRNSSVDSVAVSVHAYSPPLSAMTRYDLTPGGLVPGRTEGADDW